MIRRAHPHLLISLAIACAGVGSPALALARGGQAASGSSSSPGSGGAGLSGDSTAPGSGTGGSAFVQAANGQVSTSGGGITLRTVESGLLKHGLRFTGTAPAGDAGRVIDIERAVDAAGTRWVLVADATVNSQGGFSVVWRANHAGRLAIEAVLGSPTGTSTARRTARTGAAAPVPRGAATPALTVTVYRPARASFYGPGFWGQQTACGETLTRSTLGVASRTLPCGAQVEILYRGRSITVPVIDRGPYASGITWDLTEATASALGINGTTTIGTIGAR